MAQYPAAENPRILRYPIDLGVTVNSVPLSDACRERYRLALAADLLDVSRLVNELICNGSMCPYISGAPGTGVRVNESAVITKHYVFTAIDTASLSNPISFDVDTSTVRNRLRRKLYAKISAVYDKLQVSSGYVLNRLVTLENSALISVLAVPQRRTGQYGIDPEKVALITPKLPLCHTRQWHG